MDGVASACESDGRHVNRRAAVPADDVLAVLYVSLAAANLAGIKRRSDRVARVEEGDQTDFRASDIHNVPAKLSVEKLRHLDVRFAVNRGKPLRGGHRLRRERINRLGADQYDDEQAGGARSD